MAKKEKAAPVKSSPVMDVKSVKCLTQSQKAVINGMKNSPVTIVKGIAGSGKSHAAIAEALYMIKQGLYKKLYLIKSVTVVANEDIGFLPGDLYEKMEGFMFSYNYLIDKIVGKEGAHGTLLHEGTVAYMPIAYVRGVTLEDAIIIIDETQNITLDVAKTIMSRIGANSKMIFMGDTDQIDMKNKSESALGHLFNMFQNKKYVSCVEMSAEDCIRNPIITNILSTFKEYEGSRVPGKQYTIGSRDSKRMETPKPNVQFEPAVSYWGGVTTCSGESDDRL